MILSKEKHLFFAQNKNFRSFKVVQNALSIHALNLVPLNVTLKELGYSLIGATSLDEPYKFNRFKVLYVYGNYMSPLMVYLNINISYSIPSIADIFSSAIWLEREMYDMMGIYFTDNNKFPDLRRILTDYNFKGHPLRKDFSVIGYGEHWFSHLGKGIINKSSFF